MGPRSSFVFAAQLWSLGWTPVLAWTTEGPTFSTGVGLLFILSSVIGLVAGIGGCLALAVYLDCTRESLHERLVARDKLLNKWRGALSEARVQMVQLIREEAELRELKHEAMTRIKNDQQLYAREVTRKVQEAEKAKRTVDFVAAQNNIGEGAETVALHGRLQAEREAMARSIRKKLKRAEQTRHEVGQRARQEAQREVIAVPKRVDGLTTFFRRRPSKEAEDQTHQVIDESKTKGRGRRRRSSSQEEQR